MSQSFSTWVSGIENSLGLPLDFSCYVMIDNTRGASDLLLTAAAANHGWYVVSPPSWIRRGTVGRFILQDPKPSIFGSEGSATYTYCDASLAMQTVVFSYECPTGFTDNRAASSQADWPCVAKSGDPNGPWSGQVPGAGHPLYAAYVAGDGEPNEGKRRQVTRTGKDSRDDITHLCGGPDAGWGPVPVAEAITEIQSSAVSYFTGVGGDDALVIVVDGPGGPYLRTDPDASVANNLDALPDC